MTQMHVEPARFEIVAREQLLKPDLATVTDAPSITDPANAGGRLRPFDLVELFALDIKPRGMVLDPIIPEKGLAMLYGTRGTGKTHVALGIAYAVATGSDVPAGGGRERPRSVLLIDGEMPAQALRERLARVVATAEGTPRPRRSRSSPATWSTTASATWRSRRCRPSSSPGSTASNCSSSTTCRA